MIKLSISLFLSLFLISCNSGQEQFTVQIEPLTLKDAPRVQSFSWGKTSDGKWLILGGRMDGLHQRQPFAAFREKDNNKKVFLIDPINNKTLIADLSILPPSLFEQLQSTNQEFIQRENTLYIIGGYGYSETQQNHITYSNLTAINIDGLAKAVINKADITPFFRQITDENLAVTGGELGLLNNVFYLCGGQYFEGRYNPMGPNHGPGFIQEYTDEIRKFEIIDDGINLSINNYSADKDTENLHKRDYNMAPQIFPDGTQGFTMFSGVFQHNADLPWLNSVDITSTNYKVNSDFKQYLSQYHSAKVPMFNSEENDMYTIFFGGISQYKLNEKGELVRDDNVPFVKTISEVVRHKDGSMTESSLTAKMPSFLGSGAEFIPVSDQSIYLENDIVNLKNLKKGPNLIGYIFGGIQSTQENIFFRNNGSQSSASNQVFKVFFVKK